ncbi:MAG TPA: hypothetical protein VIC05_03125 [Solirubrobacteraceae bacterium]|jgi:hypothetical protein
MAAAAKPHPSPPAKPHKCTPHAVAYRVSGALVSSDLTTSGRHMANGTITVMVSGANKAAKNAGATKGSTQTYTLTNTTVHYAHVVAQPNPAAGTRTVVKGTITVVEKKCQGASGAGQVTIKRVDFTPAPKRKP